MTILTKQSLLSKKEVALKLSECPVVIESDRLDEQEQDMLFMEPPSLRSSTSAFMCVVIMVLLVASVGMLAGLGIYRQATRPNVVHTFQGFCSIPLETDDGDLEDKATLIEPHYRVPLRWSSEPRLYGADEPQSEDVLMALREEVDIGNMLEKISVFDGPGGRATSFIHDFAANVSGIIDNERCFLMDMDAEVVLPPSLFVLSIETGGEFDIARVRDTMRAVLPPLVNFVRTSRPIAERCADRLTYKLERQEGVIRKRSTDPIQEAHFAHFAGKHVQEIAIANLDELIAFEKGHV